MNKNSLIATLTQLTSISVSDAINASSDLDSNNIFFGGGGSPKIQQ